MIPGDFHTHTVYCDGKNTPYEMVEKALELGLTSIGFTGHGYTSKDDTFCMSKDNTARYIEEVLKLKSEYDGKIDILLGLEADLHSEFDRSVYDYIIGSVHYFSYDGVKFDVDESIAQTKQAIDYFGGVDELAKVYYNEVKKLKPVTDCDIVGHFDILTKFNEQEKLFDTESNRYRELAIDAVDTLLEYDVIFEVNTGAITRGYRTTPYPDPFILNRIHEKGGSIILTSDAHSINGICAYFDEALELVKSVGFTSVKTITCNGFADIKI